MVSTVSVLLYMGIMEAGREDDCLKLAAGQYLNGSGYRFLTSRQVELEDLGYSILDGLSDYNQVPLSSDETSNAEHTLPAESFLYLHKCVM